MKKAVAKIFDKILQSEYFGIYSNNPEVLKIVLVIQNL